MRDLRGPQGKKSNKLTKALSLVNAYEAKPYLPEPPPRINRKAPSFSQTLKFADLAATGGVGQMVADRLHGKKPNRLMLAIMAAGSPRRPAVNKAVGPNIVSASTYAELARLTHPSIGRFQDALGTEKMGFNSPKAVLRKRYLSRISAAKLGIYPDHKTATRFDRSRYKDWSRGEQPPPKIWPAIHKNTFLENLGINPLRGTNNLPMQKQILFNYLYKGRN